LIIAVKYLSKEAIDNLQTKGGKKLGRKYLSLSPLKTEPSKVAKGHLETEVKTI
jgi:hypothetical protein